MLDGGEQLGQIHTWRSSAGKGFRRRKNHVGRSLLVCEACCDAASTFFSRQSVSARLGAAWGGGGGVPVTGPGFGDETSTTYKIG